LTSSIRTKWNTDGKGISKSPLDEAETDLEDTQVTAIMAVEQVTQTLMNNISAFSLKNAFPSHQSWGV